MSSQIDFIVDKTSVSSADMKIKKSGWFEFVIVFLIFLLLLQGKIGLHALTQNLFAIISKAVPLFEKKQNAK